MKKLLLLTVMLTSPLFGATIYESMQKFVEGEKHHKNKCFDFEMNLMDAKFALLKKQHAEMYDHKIKCIERLKNEGFSEQLLRDELAEKIAMCDRHLDEWKKLCDEKHVRGDAMYREAKAKINEFKQAQMGGYKSMDMGGYGRSSESPNFLEQALEMLRGNA